MKKIKENDFPLYNKVQEALSTSKKTRWNHKYNMSRFEWDKKYFQELIGGIKTSNEEKNICLKKIKQTILENKKGKVVELDKEIILKSYPESIDLLKDYYDSLIHAHKVESNSEYKDFNQYDLMQNRKWERALGGRKYQV